MFTVFLLVDGLRDGSVSDLRSCHSLLKYDFDEEILPKSVYPATVCFVREVPILICEWEFALDKELFHPGFSVRRTTRVRFTNYAG